MDHALQIALLLLLLLLLLHRPSLTSSAAYSQPMLPSPACSDELLTFSSCLPFIAVYPHNLTDFPPPQCCHDVSAVSGIGSAVCLCYFLLQQKIAINSTKLLSLASVCPLNSNTKISLQKLYSGVEITPATASMMKISYATLTGDMNEAPLMQQSPSTDYPPSDDTSSSTLPDLSRHHKPHKPHRPPNPPTPPKPPTPFNPPTPPNPPTPFNPPMPPNPPTPPTPFNPPNPPNPPTLPNPPTPPSPPTVPPNCVCPPQAPGPISSSDSSQSTNLSPLSPLLFTAFAKSLFILLLIICV